MRKLIWVTTKVPGFHQWSEAPDNVSFLRNKHRHIFHVKLMIEVHGEDRDVEFFSLKKELDEFIPAPYPIFRVSRIHDFGERSCETIARGIFDFFNKRYKVISVEVSEDGENGAIVSL